MFGFGKKKQPVLTYDRETLRPVILQSICTGEQTAGFREISSGKFHAVQLLKSPRDLESFMESWGLAEVPPTEY